MEILRPNFVISSHYDCGCEVFVMDSDSELELGEPCSSFRRVLYIYLCANTIGKDRNPYLSLTPSYVKIAGLTGPYSSLVVSQSGKTPGKYTSLGKARQKTEFETAWRVLCSVRLYCPRHITAAMRRPYVTKWLQVSRI